MEDESWERFIEWQTELAKEEQYKKESLEYQNKQLESYLDTHFDIEHNLVERVKDLQWELDTLKENNKGYLDRIVEAIHFIEKLLINSSILVSFTSIMLLSLELMILQLSITSYKAILCFFNVFILILIFSFKKFSSSNTKDKTL